MEKNNNVIFFGNGLNRVQEGLDWNKLINQVSGTDYIKGLSNTLQYDVAFLSKKLNYKGDSSVSPAENNFKKELADEIIKSQKNTIKNWQLCQLKITSQPTMNIALKPH